MDERLPMIQVAVVQAKSGVQRNIPSTTKCPLCDRIPEDHELVLRIQDYDAGPGIHETVLHKTCVLAMLAVTDDVEEIDETFRAVLYEHAAN